MNQNDKLAKLAFSTDCDCSKAIDRCQNVTNLYPEQSADEWFLWRKGKLIIDNEFDYPPGISFLVACLDCTVCSSKKWLYVVPILLGIIQRLD
jgi:hypothetical protein